MLVNEIEQLRRRIMKYGEGPLSEVPLMDQVDPALDELSDALLMIMERVDDLQCGFRAVKGRYLEWRRRGDAERTWSGRCSAVCMDVGLSLLRGGGGGG
jgi:hypothetical protein